jgi:hypothetical protein
MSCVISVLSASRNVSTGLDACDRFVTLRPRQYTGVQRPCWHGSCRGRIELILRQPAPTRTTTPPSGVSVRTESKRTRFKWGAVRFLQHSENEQLFESVSIWVKGGWKETRGVQRPTSGQVPVSESRMASLKPSETKRKKAPSRTSSRVCDVQVAERKSAALSSGLFRHVTFSLSKADT